VVDALIAAGAGVDGETGSGATPMMLAVSGAGAYTRPLFCST
jgi:hypothetical protein